MTTIRNEVAVFGGGCFWCTEAVFKMLKGVISVEPGYAGGHTETDSAGSPQAPTYEQVVTGETGHAEVTRVEYNPSQIHFRDLMTVFFASHDPSSLNRQGNDVGTQYRSAIFYTTREQEQEARALIVELDAVSPEGPVLSGAEGGPIVTEVVPLEKFWPAENYHHDYFANNEDQPYCQLVINPKLDKIQKDFANLLATNVS